ncbi:hypothetical protein DYH10_01680 [Candidatus Saccharibacteria bacterium CPR2]|nr:hypothetical protein [Candidatus Saccharibacteria bacterium CPR2]
MISRRPRRTQAYKKKTLKAKSAALTTKAKTLIKGDDKAPIENASGRITNETVAKHREEVLKGAKRFIYPLQHSKHRIAIISTAIAVLALVSLVIYISLILYRYQHTGIFAYNLTKIIPLPVARVDGQFVSYEDYLFELRHSMHFQRTQEAVDFSTEEGQKMLVYLKQQALERAKDNTVVRELAKQNNIKITEQEINAQMDLILKQGTSGQSLDAIEKTLAEFYGWSIKDWKRVLKMQLMKQRLIPNLDTETTQKGDNILNQLTGGASFADLAKLNSQDDLSKDKGGSLGIINIDNTNLPQSFIDVAFNLNEGEYSNLVESTIKDEKGKNILVVQIIRADKVINDKEREISHILLKYKNIDEKINQYKTDYGVTNYIKV